MQTFLPTSDFEESARLLDYKRLGKQRVEGMQLLNAMQPDYPHKGWLNHPAKKMWEGYEDCLKYYVNCMIREWKGRGYNNTMKLYDHPPVFDIPEWMGNEKIHKSHRMNLLRKDFKYYSRHWPEEAYNHAHEVMSYPYYWPTSNGWYISTPDRSGTRPLEEGI